MQVRRLGDHTPTVLKGSDSFRFSAPVRGSLSNRDLCRGEELIRRLDTARRLTKLEKLVAQVSEQQAREGCICGKLTKYHTAEELEAILSERCPEHGPVRPEFLMHAPNSWVLLPEYRKYCKCPPHPWRDFEEGKRARPTADELMDFSNSELRKEQQEQRSQEEREKAFRENSARIRRILENHERLLAASEKQ
jgi:hypothetical protein